MTYDQLDIHSINRTSGVYRLHLNFDGNPKWTSTGVKARIQAQGCLMSISGFSSSRLTEDMSNTLGNLKVELSDHPDLAFTDDAGSQTGNVIRECFEAAHDNKLLVHAVLARYSNEATPVFQEFVFAGSFDPREMSVAHRFKPKVGRRSETLSFEFTPAKRLDVSLGDVKIDWKVTDMRTVVRPIWLCIASEPGWESVSEKTLPNVLSDIVITGVGGLDPRSLTADLAYGVNPLSRNTDVDKLKDNPGNVFTAGNFTILLSVAIDKLFTACDMVWDGVFPSDLNFRKSIFDNLTNLYSDQGEITPDLIKISWNYAFGYNPYQQGATFKAPCTFDVSMTCRDFLKAIAAQLKSRIDIYAYDADGLPKARFLALGQSSGTFPALEEREESTEDAIITDKDGVRVTRRGYSGSVIAPANAVNPIDIEIPFAPFAIGYETAPCFDITRLKPNPGLSVIDQWKVAFRGPLTDDTAGAAAESTYPLNPDGWGLASHLFYEEADVTLKHFPASHDASGTVPGIQDIYVDNWHGDYPVHAVYDVDRSTLSDEEIKDRQRNFLISYALVFGRYIRGERRQVHLQFKGCVAPLWSDIKTGQTYNFKPLTVDVQYAAVSIERDIDEDIITVLFEEVVADTLPITYREEGDGKSSGTLGGQGGTSPTVDYDNSDFLTKHPKTDARDFIILGQDSIGGGITGFSGQTKDLWQYQNSALVILSGVKAGGTFFTNVQDAINIYADNGGVNTGETRFFALDNSHYKALKAPTVFTNTEVFILPSASPTVGQFLSASAPVAGVITLSWATAITSLTGALLNSPATANRNLVTPTVNGVIPLEIKGKSGSSADLILVQTSASQNIFQITSAGLINLYGNVILNAIGGITTIGLDTGSGIAIGTKGQGLVSGNTTGKVSWINIIKSDPYIYGANLIQPSGDSEGLIIKPFGSGVLDCLQIFDTSNVQRVRVAFDGDFHIGDLTAEPISPTYGETIGVYQKSTGNTGILIKRFASSTADLFLWMDDAEVIQGNITPEGNFGTTKKISAGTLAPAVRLHSKESSLGLEDARFENNSLIHDRLLDQVSTTNNTATVIHNFSIPTDKDTINVEGVILAYQTGGAGGVVGHTYRNRFEFTAKNVGGVVSKVAGTFHTDVVEDADAEAALWVVTGIVNGTSIDVKVQTPQNNRDVTWKLDCFTKFYVNFA